MTESRSYTHEEARRLFLDSIREKANYWDSIPLISKKDALDGLAFGILVLIDGLTNSPAFDLVVRTHEDDKQNAIECGDNYYEDGMVVNEDVYLHELWYPKGKP